MTCKQTSPRVKLGDRIKVTRYNGMSNGATACVTGFFTRPDAGFYAKGEDGQSFVILNDSISDRYEILSHSPKVPAKYSSYAAVWEAPGTAYTIRAARSGLTAPERRYLIPSGLAWRLRWLHPDEGNSAPQWVKDFERSGNYAGWEPAKPVRKFKVGDKVVATASAGARFAFPAYGVVKSDDNCGSYPYYVQFAALKANDRHHSNVALWCAEKDMEAVND